MKLAMRSTSLIALFMWLFLIAACSGRVPPPAAQLQGAAGVPKQLLDRQVIITLSVASQAAWERTTASLAQAYALSRAGVFLLGSIGVQCVVFQVPSDRSLPTLMAQLQADPRVESVQPNQFFQGQGLLPYNDQYARHQYGVQAVRAALVHRYATGKGVKVAIIDIGVDTTHPDLQGRIATMANFVAGGKASFDRDRHGTAVAGVIAAKANNDIGIFGVAPEADLMALKACWHGSSPSEPALCSSWTIAHAVDFALQNGAQVLNFSLAGPTDPLLERLLAQALSQGVITVAATLQRPGGEMGFPASRDGVIAVVSSDLQGRAHALAFGADQSVVAAPGVEIITTTPQRAYDFLSGSSLAAAHVSGIAALMLEDHPNLPPARVRSLLQATSQPIDNAGAQPKTKTVVGIVDACAALQRLDAASFCPAS